MNTRTQRRVVEEERSFLDESENTLDLEALSDEDLETILFDDESTEKRQGFWNLPTIAGLSLIVVGVAYLFQELGIWNGFDFSILVSMLPWLAGILIILIGFGVLSWRPKKKTKKVARVKKGSTTLKAEKEVPGQSGKTKKRLVKSADKKIAGVAGGIAEYFAIDPTLVRIAFVIGTIATQGSFLIAYLILAFVMPKPEVTTVEERITIIRDV
jgi:phage shock protein C